ncbi:MAG: AI-2E family transporter, partial [Caldilinea sp.]|nr:AI-2E family transporter [Caldilinea sp.]MDW8440745.1 AI-2E family transporter [Caldilineaceae bacterium]
MTHRTYTSPPWPRNVKTIVAVALLLAVALAFWRFFEFVELFALAALLAFLLSPIVNALRRWVRLPQALAITIAYLLFAAIVSLLVLLVGAAVQSQIAGLVINVQETLRGLMDLATWLLTRLIAVLRQIGGSRLQLPPVNELMPQFYESLAGQMSGFIGQGGTLVTGVAQTALLTVTRTIVLIVLSIYLLVDGARIFHFFQKAADQLGYGEDAALLLADFTNIWKTYFLGQLLLALIMSVAVSVIFFALRVDNPIMLGLIAGLFELVPVLGQYLTMVVTVILVFFQPEPPGGLQPWLYTLLVAGVLFSIQQIQGNVILPRLHGRSLAIHPMLILLGVLIGASFAGVFGAILAPP